MLQFFGIAKLSSYKLLFSESFLFTSDSTSYLHTKAICEDFYGSILSFKMSKNKRNSKSGKISFTAKNSKFVLLLADALKSQLYRYQHFSQSSPTRNIKRVICFKITRQLNYVKQYTLSWQQPHKSTMRGFSRGY